MSQQQVKQDLASGRVTGLLGAGFRHKHGTPGTSNLEAVALHAGRQNRPPRNTVLDDASELIREIKDQPITSPPTAAREHLPVRP